MKQYWFNLSDKIRFLIVGGFNAGVSYLIYSAFCIILGEHAYQIALALAWIISSVVSFTTQKFFVFRAKGNWMKEYLKCCTTWVFSYMINAGLLEIIVKVLHINVFIAQIIATLIRLRFFSLVPCCFILETASLSWLSSSRALLGSFFFSISIISNIFSHSINS